MVEHLTEKNNVWSSTRISTRTTFVFNIHNDLPGGINSLYKIFADDTSPFSNVYDRHK